MNKIFLALIIIVLNLAFTNCADESYQSATTPEDDSMTYNFDRAKLAPLDDKFLFLEDYYNENGDKEFKEPYHYHFSILKLLAIRRIKEINDHTVEIRIPSSDCNYQHLECSAENGVFNCGAISTLMGCFYRNDLSNYYNFPASFIIDVNLRSVVIADTKSKSRAVFKVYDSKEELPVYKEPSKIME